MNEEQKRIKEKDNEQKDWLRWGPYLTERQWGTVREDYSEDGTAWNYFPHDMARSRVYRWGEDGIAGISDRYCNICFAIAMWNGKDPILKERLFGLTNSEGNHGEDVKEHYFYLENVPTHSYMKYLYKYPQQAFPYDELVTENKKRNQDQLEYEIQDTGVFDNDRYFDVFTEYAKQDTDDILIRISVNNRYNAPATMHLLPTLWIRNYWSFREMKEKPVIRLQTGNKGAFAQIEHKYTGSFHLYFQEADKHLFTENETNTSRLDAIENDHPYKKDLFHEALQQDDFSVATENNSGTKFSPYYQLDLDAHETKIIQLRLTKDTLETPFAQFDDLFKQRIDECNVFYRDLAPSLSEAEQNIQKQAFSGLLWSKQYYNYDVETWLKGDPKQPKPPASRWKGRNADWQTFRNHDILLMPDKWEYPWFASWDSSFHCVTMAHIDPDFAKEQLLLFTKEWYMAPNGKIPAYEWAFSDTNPPVQPWAAFRIYSIEKERTGQGDIVFLKRMFNKLALNFTWWVNQKDLLQNNVFEGGFLGLDNIGVFDRSHGIPEGAILEQVDGTAWMALYCLTMLQMSLEISKEDPSFEDMATKYFGHFVFIAEALNQMSAENEGIWDEQDGFFYDKLIFRDGSHELIKVRSIEGILALVAALTIDSDTFEKLPRFKRSFEWFKKYRMNQLKFPVIQERETDGTVLLSLVPENRLRRLTQVLLDENKFLSHYGIRALSKEYTQPYQLNINGQNYSIHYEPAESKTGLFGGNSNWRGPIWFPINFIIIRALKEHFRFFGNDVQVAFPTGNDKKMNLQQVANEISKRLIRIFEPDTERNRPVNGLYSELFAGPFYKDYILFYEYFHGETGRGVGASHQTGWTALVANMILEKQ